MVALSSCNPQDFVVERPEKYGGTVRFATYKEIEEAYARQEIYPLDLKHAVTRELNLVSNRSFVACLCYLSALVSTAVGAYKAQV